MMPHHPTPLGSLLAAAAGSQDPFALTPTGPVSRERFSFETRVLAGLLAARSERRWALVAEDTAVFARGFFALAAAGKTILLPQGTAREAINATDAEALLSDGAEGPTKLPRLSLTPPAEAEPLRDGDFDPTAVTLSLHTSGSTAQPKRVTKTLAQVDAEISALERQWGVMLGAAPVMASVPHHHLYGILVRILWPLAAGRPFHAATVASPAALGASPPGAILVSSPAFLTRIAEPAAFGTFAPRAIFSSGAPLPAATALAIGQALGTAPIEIYGSTETGGIAWRTRSSADEADAAWQTLPGMELRFDEEGAGKRLVVRSPWTTAGEWMVTGDLATPIADARFLLAGRADGVVKLEDKRINLEELAARLETHANVERARVIVLEGSSRQRLGAVIVPTPAGAQLLANEGKAAFVARLDALLTEHYERVLVPRKWRIVPALPVNAMGKIERIRLEALFAREAS
ncbi:MAG: AMP-binding protein [Gammaproteobacteria bacterium]